VLLISLSEVLHIVSLLLSHFFLILSPNSKISDLQKRGYILTQQSGLTFDLDQPKLEIQLNISQTNETYSFNNGFATSRVWSEILKNSSEVYLHTLILKDDAKDLDEISPKVLNVIPSLPSVACGP
jgi:hypothetical protein